MKKDKATDMSTKIRKGNIAKTLIIAKALETAMDKVEVDGVCYGKYIAPEDTDAKLAERLGEGITGAMVMTRRKTIFGNYPPVTPKEPPRPWRVDRAVENSLSYKTLTGRIAKVQSSINGLDAKLDERLSAIEQTVVQIKSLIDELNRPLSATARLPFGDGLSRTGG